MSKRNTPVLQFEIQLNPGCEKILFFWEIFRLARLVLLVGSDPWYVSAIRGERISIPSADSNVQIIETITYE
jgi:hypothetical protein